MEGNGGRGGSGGTVYIHATEEKFNSLCLLQISVEGGAGGKKGFGGGGIDYNYYGRNGVDGARGGKGFMCF